MDIHDEMYKNIVESDPFLSPNPWPSNDYTLFSPTLGFNNLSPFHLPISTHSLHDSPNSPKYNINNINSLELEPMALTDTNHCFHDLTYNNNVFSNVHINQLEQEDESPFSTGTISLSDQSSLSSNLIVDINSNPILEFPKNISNFEQSIQPNVYQTRVTDTIPNSSIPNIHNNSIHHAPAPPIITTLTNTTNTINITNIQPIPELPFIPQLYPNTNSNSTTTTLSPLLPIHSNTNTANTEINIPPVLDKMSTNNVIVTPTPNIRSNNINRRQISYVKKPLKIKAKTIKRKPTTKKIKVTKPSKIPKPIKSKIVNKIQNKHGIIKRQKLHSNYPNMTHKKEQNEEIRRIKNPKTRRKTTAIACIKCWKAKTRCGVQRPCNRCVRIGYEDECVDRPLSSRSRQNVKAPKIIKRKNKYKNKKQCAINHNVQPCNNIHSKTLPVLPPFVSSKKSSRTSKQKLKPFTIIANKIEKPSLAVTSLSAIIGGFNKQSNKLRKTPMNHKFDLPPSILNESENNSFVYLPILTQYQICAVSNCKLCYGVLQNYHEHNNELHLETPHNYSCPNTNCDRKFVLQNHLSIHLKICKESKHLSTNLVNCKKINEMSNDEFGKCIQLSIESPIKNYYSRIRYEDVHPSKLWIEEQYKFKQLLSELLNKNKNKNEYIHVPLFKRRKTNS